MKLDAYIAASGKKPIDLARDAGLSASTVSRLLSKKRRPGLDVIAKIHRATGGAVSALDWMDIAGPSEEVA